MNRMQQTTVGLVFLDLCGCGPTPRIHPRAEHPGGRSMAADELAVKRDLVVTASVRVWVHVSFCACRWRGEIVNGRIPDS